MKLIKGTDTVALLVWVLVGLVLPVVVLLGAGSLWLWQQGWLLWFVASWAGVTAVAWLGWRWWAHRAEARLRAALHSLAIDQSEADRPGTGTSVTGKWADHSGSAMPPEPSGSTANSLPGTLAERDDWSARDRAIWARVSQRIDLNLEGITDWRSLPDAALDVLGVVANEYHAGRSEALWRFTLPEALLVVSVASARYRTLVQTHVPFADRIALGTVMSVYRQQDRISRGWNYATTARRVLRLANPVGAIAGELRDHLTNQLVDRVSHTLQHSLRRLLLQEIGQVSIDLYSGRLKVSDEELAQYRSAGLAADAERTADEPEPLRVVLFGQVSAGKSSLVNALLERLGAETDLLPTTERLTAHELATPDGQAWHLIDTPGLGAPGPGDDSTLQALVDESLHADVLVWVVRANQPARAPDKALIEAIDTAWTKRPERRKPPSLLLMTHVDRLPPPGPWEPPYSTDDTTGRGATMRQALRAIREQIALPSNTTALPVCTVDAQLPWNLDAVVEQLQQLADDARKAQLNRRRIESGESRPGWRERGRQARNLGKAAIRPFWK